MTNKTKMVAIAVALAVLAALVAVCMRGCRSEAPQKPALPESSPAVYMKDPAFRQTLSNQVERRNGLAKARGELAAQMEKMVDAMKAKMPNADDATVKAALEKDPEWNSLYKRIVDANTALEENRKETTAIVGQRIAPAKTTSK